MPGPLTGHRVLELTTTVSGPMAGMMLADQGAEVIKVEPANGDSYRYQGGTVDGDISPDFHFCNRGKLSIVVNARNEAGLEVF